MLDYVLLDPTADVGLIDALTLTNPAELATLLQAGPLFADTEPPTQVTGTVKLNSGEVLLLPHELVENKAIRLFRAPEPWRDLGPSQPANPALSWEYWNGESWWALAGRELVDETANFQQSGGVFFTVPADVQPTDVAGRTEHWLRVRLAGGDYGEAKVTVVGQPGAAPNTTEQVVVRDVSTVRAPYITSLKLGYCAIAPVRPEIVLTQDSLGAVDQTSANEAGLAFPVFTPIAELMNPVSAAEATAAAAADADSCDDPCPPPESSAPSPCDAPGAYESCDSPCIAPPGYRSPAGTAATGFVRGLMIGFSKPFAGDTVSLYIDAEPAGPPAELAADILQGGRFTPVNLVKDTSYGLTEPGILTLALPGPPDTSELFGASAHWLRLRPKGDSGTWAPKLRGIHLNAVRARSIETRAMERLGQSIGAADQEFRLTEPPVEYRSLELRVRELLADEERADPALDIVTYPAGPAGDWVRWQATEDLVDTGNPQRVFVLDAEAGLVRFGDGMTGRIPPLGADILAVHYAHVTGSKANAVEAGKQLQTLSPLAGVERVLALDNAAGGSDAEALESARRRAAAKVRHGGRILSRADIEEYAPTLSPGIAQVRAEKKNGGTRLIVVMAGLEPRPSPAQLREYGAAIREVAGYGIARPGGLNVVGPRLLPLAVDLVLRPLTPDLFAEAAEQAKTALAALFDPATGNHDGKGWPLGRLPDEQDIAAALVAIEDLALPESVTLERADKELASERALPASIPSDVLVRLDSVALERAQEEAA
jgi:predicted phage baseplate assembly protein